MKKLLTTLAVLALIVGFGVMRAEAATDTIAVTVTLRNVSVLITVPVDKTLALGTMEADTTSSAQSCTAKNDGNAQEDFTIKVGNSSPAGWTPAAAAAANKFVMKLDGTTALTGSDTTLANDVAANGTDDFTLTFTTPSSSADYTQQTITVTVTAAAG